jgi:hypothetical protein
MAIQTFATHRHRPTMTIAGTFCLLVGVVGFILRGIGIGGHLTMAIGLSGLVGAIFMLLTMSRVYTTALQDRIIKLEMHVRCLSLLTPAQQVAAARLDKAQLVALRFASDAELPALVEQAERDRLSADQIKRAIKNWVPDLNRT